MSSVKDWTASVIKQAESINKTYPAFFEDFCALGGKADVISNR